MRTWPVAALSLVLGFGVAELTGVRAIGGVVLVLGAAWCALRWERVAGRPAAIGLLALFLALFALSHVLGLLIGAWPSVAVVAVAMALGARRWGDATAPRAVVLPA